MEKAALDNLHLASNPSVPMTKNYPIWEASGTEQCTLSSDAFSERSGEKDSSVPAGGRKERAGVPDQSGSGFSALEEIGPDCKCMRKCFQRIGTKTIQKIFRNFWAMADCKSQNAYLCGLLSMIKLTEKYKKKETSRRNFTVFYHVKDKGRKRPVCKRAFFNIHGLHKNRKRIYDLMDQMKGGESPPRKRVSTKGPIVYTQEDIDHVHKHLLACQKMNETIDCTSKSAILSEQRCYVLYLNEYCRNNKLVPVSMDKFMSIYAEKGYAHGL